jgi:hypothetical protein
MPELADGDDFAAEPGDYLSEEWRIRDLVEFDDLDGYELPGGYVPGPPDLAECAAA